MSDHHEDLMRRRSDLTALFAGDQGRPLADDPMRPPWQVSIAGQQLLEAILGDDYFDLSEVVGHLLVLADFTSDVGAVDGRLPWTRERVAERCRELAETYNPPEELGGEAPADWRPSDDDLVAAW